MILVLLLLIILVLIFKDSILKIFINGGGKLLDRGDVISKEYKIELCSNKSIYIDVLDTDIKIVFDKSAEQIDILTKCLSEELAYNVTSQGNSIKILRNDMESHNNPGNSGKILIRIPEKYNLEEINVLITNGDVEVNGVNSKKFTIKCKNGTLKMDSISAKDIEIFKLHGDVYISHADVDNLKLNIKDGNGDFVDVYGDNMYVNVVNGDFIFGNVCRDDYYIKSLKLKTLNGKHKLNVNANVITD